VENSEHGTKIEELPVTSHMLEPGGAALEQHDEISRPVRRHFILDPSGSGDHMVSHNSQLQDCAFVQPEPQLSEVMSKFLYLSYFHVGVKRSKVDGQGQHIAWELDAVITYELLNVDKR
jgi:hypothetical protein